MTTESCRHETQLTKAYDQPRRGYDTEEVETVFQRRSAITLTITLRLSAAMVVTSGVRQVH